MHGSDGDADDDGSDNAVDDPIRNVVNVVAWTSGSEVRNGSWCLLNSPLGITAQGRSLEFVEWLVSRLGCTKWTPLGLLRIGVEVWMLVFFMLSFRSKEPCMPCHHIFFRIPSTVPLIPIL